jgi:RNA polymerase sporulation-specific sigma factor
LFDADARRQEDGMDREKESVLWERCRAGDPNAREELIVAYRPLVFWLAGKLKASSLKQDLIQEGMVALIGAVDRFDPKRDLRFSTYAYHRIRGQMINLLDRSERRAPIPVDSESFLFPAETDPVDEEWQDVAESVARLEGKEAAVVAALFFDGKRPAEVAGEQKMDISHVYRLRRSAIARIREWLGLGEVLP